MKTLSELNLWFPGGVITDQLCRELGAARGACGPVRVFALEDQGQILRQGLVTPDSVQILSVETDMKVVNFSKGYIRMLLQTAEPVHSEEICRALWPKHPLYQVGENAPRELRETFLPGMTTYRCQETENGILIEAFTIPGDDPMSILEHVQQTLASAGFAVQTLSLINQPLPPFRAALDEEVVAALVRTFFRCYGRGPNFEWDQTGTLLRNLGSVSSNTFAIGPGLPEAAMAVSPDKRSAEQMNPFPEWYIGFLRQLIKELRDSPSV